MSDFKIGPRVWHADRLWDRTINGARYRFVNHSDRIVVMRNPGEPGVVVHEWYRLDQYRIADGSLEGQFRQTLPTLRRNLEWSAYQAVPGTPVRDGRNGTRLQPEAEAAKVRPYFVKHAEELRARDPRGFEAWYSAYLDWKSADPAEEMPSPEDFASGGE